MERRVVITAEAAITPIGNTKKKILEHLTGGISGVKAIRYDSILDPVLRSRIFGTVTDEIEYDFKRKYRKTMGPVSYYACQAAKEALEKSGLSQDFISSGRMGIAFGSTQGSPNVQRELYGSLFSGSFNLDNLNSSGYIQQMTHTTAVNIAQMFQITGRAISSCTACTTSSQSIGLGYEAIKFGLQDAMLCGGADEYDLLTVAVFDKLLAASTAYNESPSATPRPFDKKRDGLVVGEGTGVVLLEEYEFAKKRGAVILAEVLGFSCRNNGGDLIHPKVEGVEDTIREGLSIAKLNPEDVDFVSAHATATPVGDVIEAQALYRVYGDQPYVSGLKSYTGHTIGACGAIESIFALYMMQENLVIPTLNLETPDEECAMLRHPMTVREEPVKVVSVQNFAFGGVNTALFYRKI